MAKAKAMAMVHGYALWHHGALVQYSVAAGGMRELGTTGRI